MSGHEKNGPLAMLICFALIASACQSSQQDGINISTAVAQTVQAGESLTQIANLPTLTSEPAIEATPISQITPTSALTLVSAPADPNCISATLVSEYPPDGVILAPGEYFWKTWTFQNTGTCTWNSSYKLIFWNGDLMDGLVSYPFPDEVLPGEQKDISIYLRAPTTTGAFTGYWRMQTPWNADFGVGPFGEPFYVQIVVSSDKKPKYGITSVAYIIERNPPEGCPTNVRYTIHATITTNGPYDLDYYWNQSDGNDSNGKPLKFDRAGSKTLSREWMIGKGDSPNPRWVRIVVTGPDYREYEKAVILNNCP